MKTLGSCTRIAILVLLVELLQVTAPAVAAAGPPVAQALATSQGVEWVAQVEHGGLVLTVSQPDGTVVRKEAARGETLRFGLFDASGRARPEGVYIWELRAAPPALAVVETAGDQTPEGRRGRVQSGTFALLGGTLYLPGEPGEGEPGEAGASRGRPTPSLGGRDQVVGDELIVEGRACVGFDCAGGEVFDEDVVRMKENNLVLRLEDTSTEPGFPTSDWQLRSNDPSSGGPERFSIEETDGGTVPFTLEAGAPTDALRVDAQGRVGLGTATPAADLHVVRGDGPSLRLEQDNTLGETPQSWEVKGDEVELSVADLTGGTTPFTVGAGSPDASLTVTPTGVGVGTAAPAAAFHLLDADDSRSARFILEDTGTGSSNKPGFRLRSPNSAASGDWAFEVDGAGNFQIDFTPSANPELVITDNPTANGTVKVNGNLVVVGSCTGCDRLFSADFPLESIDEHAAQMWKRGYLPGVGPTPEGKGQIDVFEKVTGILEELEKAHLYIEQLHEELRAQEDEIARLRRRASPKQAEPRHAARAQPTAEERDGRIADLEKRLELLEEAVEGASRGSTGSVE